MAAFWLVIYLVVAILAIVQAVLIVAQTWEHRRYARRRLSEIDLSRPTGRALLIIPCRGNDTGLEDNLCPLLEQDYGDYEVRFVVESADDPACRPIRQVMAEHPEIASQLIVAGQADACGQKVHNLLAATADLPPEIKYLAFVDSDARPKRHWLRSLLSHLWQDDVAATTGYRWFIPVRASWVNHLLYGINCNSAILLAAKVHHFVWGGSWALKREMFEQIGLRAAWQGTLSDDMIASTLLVHTKRRVVFEPACMVASPLNMSLRTMFGFVRRQYIITRWYVPLWWAFALAAATFANLAMLVSLVALACAVMAGNPPVWMAAAVCAVLYGVNVYRGLLRRSLALLYFPQRFVAVGKASRFDIWASPLVTVFNWLALVASMFGRHVTWRGITYRLLRDGKVRLLGRKDEPSSENDDPAEESLKSSPPTRPMIRYRQAG